MAVERQGREESLALLLANLGSLVMDVGLPVRNPVAPKGDGWEVYGNG